MEGYNTFNYMYNNHNAEVYCKEHNIFMTAGSDLHKIGSTEDCNLYGMEFDTPLANEADYVKRILNREGQIAVPQAHRAPENYSIEAKLPVVTNHR